MRTKILRGLTLLAVLTGITILPAQPALAAAYDYTDPAATGCSTNGAYTFWSKNLINPANGAVTGRLEARRSNGCDTNWVRVNNYINGATAYKQIQRPAYGSVPYAEDFTADTYYGWSYGLQFKAPTWLCIYVGGTLVLNGQVVGTSGQALDYIC